MTEQQMQQWKHFCSKRDAVITSYLDICPFCKQGKHLPNINESSVELGKINVRIGMALLAKEVE